MQVSRSKVEAQDIYDSYAPSVSRTVPPRANRREREFGPRLPSSVSSSGGYAGAVSWCVSNHPSAVEGPRWAREWRCWRCSSDSSSVASRSDGRTVRQRAGGECREEGPVDGRQAVVVLAAPAVRQAARAMQSRQRREEVDRLGGGRRARPRGRPAGLRDHRHVLQLRESRGDLRRLHPPAGRALRQCQQRRRRREEEETRGGARGALEQRDRRPRLRRQLPRPRSRPTLAHRAESRLREEGKWTLSNDFVVIAIDRRCTRSGWISFV